MFDEMDKLGHDIDEYKKKQILCKLKKYYEKYVCEYQKDNYSNWKKQHEITSQKIKKKQREKALRNKPCVSKSMPDILETQSSHLKLTGNVATSFPLSKLGITHMNPRSNFKRTQSSIGKTGKVTKERIIAKMVAIIETKTKTDMLRETESEKCCIGISDPEELMKKCGCLQRIEVILFAYHFLVNMDKKEWNNKLIADMIQIKDKYEHQQIFNDFVHIKNMHIDADNNQKEKFCDIPKILCNYFEWKFPCKNVEKCCKFRHCNREKSNNDDNDNNQDENIIINDDEKKEIYSDNCDDKTRDVTFRQECEKIHGYFLHSSVKHGTEANQINLEQQKKSDILAMHKGRLYKHTSVADVSDDEKIEQKNSKKSYVGKKEDNLWLQHSMSEKDDDIIYQNLTEKMGVFRWQNPHGFIAGHNHAIGHYKPRFQNPKEEALHNPYSTLSADSWNQTVAKSKIFQQSWAGKKIRTQQKGFYDDKITGQNAKWKEKDEINIKEIVTFKLYTDFDKLQFELKKCFRYETVKDILPKQTNKQPDYYRKISDQNRMKLKNRLESFYHWRGELLIALNKFGIQLNSESNKVLYHGVNKKMLIKPSQTFAFSGPLSTSSSYHVARTFATAKGMVLKMTSEFPRLNYCNAFDVSSLSDYPEEDEWLIGFMYVRLLEVRTRTLIDNYATFKDVVEKVPMSSWMRQAFFAVHLFREQILSMNEHLQRILAQCFKVNRYECCEKNVKYQDQHNYFEDWGMNDMVDVLCKREHKHGEFKRQCSAVNDPKSENSKEDLENFNVIGTMLWNKFNMFRMEPNFKQRVKFDMISEHLKRFFMEEIEGENENKYKKEWIISWDEITTVYPFVREIHFVNQYKLSDQVLKNFLEHIKDEENKIEKVLFMYYNYKNVNGKNQPSNDKIFQDPDTLDSDMLIELEKLKWKLKHGNNGKSGYKIRIYNLNPKT